MDIVIFCVCIMEPWKQRLEYAPVIFGYGVVSLLCYCVIVKMVFQTSRIYDLEQSELKMKLQIEKQKREIEKKKTQIMLEQIRPHFIYKHAELHPLSDKKGCGRRVPDDL